MKFRKHIARIICMMTVLLLCVNVVLANANDKSVNKSSSLKKSHFNEFNTKALSFSNIKKEDVNNELLTEFDIEKDLEEDLDNESIVLYPQASFDLFCVFTFIKNDQQRNFLGSNIYIKTSKLPVWLKIRHIIL